MPDNQGFSDFFYDAPDGLRLHARVYGESNADHWPVVCLPGLTRNARDFHELALYLFGQAKTRRRVIAFDYRGRGESAYDPDVANYNVGTEANDILCGLSALGIDQAAFIGTSRGGLIIHVLGVTKPSVLKAIVFNDIGPEIEAGGLAHIRDYLQKSPRVKTVDEAVAAQRAAHGQDFPALQMGDWERMVSAIYKERDRRLVPDFDPRLPETLKDMDLSQPLPTLWPQFKMLKEIPMMTIRGENSRLLFIATVEEMTRLHPGMKSVSVEGQGHAPFLETGALPGQMAEFFDSAESQR
ncbi:alpha/beta hydrolase [Mesorhizobium sp. BE184]|uniref:alpha/beta fold hydrolase n=1 Tax=Mesorhizobium sp. BE184 TaxID=2817714 RepID=UPI00285AC644|nr:alpha/beta hydrolase [Mesorhizobium sp. BE184]MDR7031771.1 pimeloyl-ACP methyl ester carboxylesterase [Mesorhizobium sp. BE184]